MHTTHHIMLRKILHHASKSARLAQRLSELRCRGFDSRTEHKFYHPQVVPALAVCICM